MQVLGMHAMLGITQKIQTEIFKASMRLEHNDELGIRM